VADARRVGNTTTVRLHYVPLVAAALLTLAGCDAFDPPNAQYGGICVDQVTEERIDDDRCGDFDDEGHASNSGTFFMWVSTSSDHMVPARGQRVPATIGSRTVPSGTPLAKGVPTAGGSMASISRGGFGVKAGTTGGYGSKAGS
jgi:hypothetical protein